MNTTAKHTKFDSLVRHAEALGLTVDVQIDSNEFGEFASAIIRRPVWDADNMLALIRNSERLFVTSYFSAFTKRNRMAYKSTGWKLADDRTLTASQIGYAIDSMARDLDVYSNAEVAA